MTCRPTLAEPVVVDQWWQTRGEKAIRIQLSTWKGKNLIDVRSWDSEQGRLRPGKGFCAEAKHLPKLVSALAKACSRARELHLIDADGGEAQ